MCVCACMRACGCVRACVRAYVCVSVSLGGVVRGGTDKAVLYGDAVDVNGADSEERLFDAHARQRLEVVASVCPCL